MSLVLLGLALAADPPPTPDPPPAPDPTMEVVVYGPAAIRQSRAAVVRELRDLGWRKGRESGGEIVFKPPKAWMGRAVLDYDGTLVFRRPVVALKSLRAANPVEPDANPHFDRDPGGLRYPTDVTGEEQGYALPHPEGTFWILPSWSVLGPVHQRVRERLDPLLEDYRAIVEATAEAEATGE